MVPADRPNALFWSGETLLERLPALIQPFSADRVDCAAYTLTIGHEVYVSPTDQASDPRTTTVRRLADGEGFTIPSGQLAFLLTEEIMTIPPDAIAFVSIKAKIKFRGLVNVSGFHVDPGFKGRFVFSVFNAGPTTIHLRQGQQVFLIWYASLDRTSAHVKNEPVQESISPELLTNVSGELQSFASISSKIKSVDKSLGERIHSIEREQTYYRVIGAIALALVVGLSVAWFRDAVSVRVVTPSPQVDTAKPRQ
jgi:dCTP deaminase